VTLASAPIVTDKLNSLQVGIVPANMQNKQSRRADKWWSSSLREGEETKRTTP